MNRDYVACCNTCVRPVMTRICHSLRSSFLTLILFFYTFTGNKTIMSYKAGIIAAIQALGDRNGSSSIAIKKHMQANLPKDKTWQNSTFLSALKNGVEKGEFLKNKNSFKLSADLKKKPKGSSAAPKPAQPRLLPRKLRSKRLQPPRKRASKRLHPPRKRPLRRQSRKLQPRKRL